MINRAVEDIGTVHARLARAVVVFTRPPEGEEWGGLVATFADPDGNTLQLHRRYAPYRDGSLP